MEVMRSLSRLKVKLVLHNPVTYGPSPMKMYSLLLILLIASASRASGARVLDPSEVLSAPLSFVPFVRPEGRRDQGFKPKFNNGGPCVPPAGRKSSLKYSGEGLDANSTFSASSITLHGEKCGSPGGGQHWKIRETAATVEELKDADKTFKFIASVSSDPTRSGLHWLYFSEAPGEGVVQCGAGRGVANLLLFRIPPDMAESFRNVPSRPEGFVFAFDATDESDIRYTCVFQENITKGETSGGGTGNDGEKPSSPARSGAGDSESSAGGRLSGGEIIGIAAGAVGILLALGVVMVATALWRRQRALEEEEGAHVNTHPDEYAV